MKKDIIGLSGDRLKTILAEKLELMIHLLSITSVIRELTCERYGHTVMTITRCALESFNDKKQLVLGKSL